MTDASTAATDRATYGNWIPQRSPGLLGAGLSARASCSAGSCSPCSPCWPPASKPP